MILALRISEQTAPAKENRETRESGIEEYYE
jgi:hypothetical protein